MYFARTSNKRGKKRHEAMAETRIAAALRVFKLDPKVEICSTSHAHQQSDGSWHNTGSSLIWHNRRETQ